MFVGKAVGEKKWCVGVCVSEGERGRDEHPCCANWWIRMKKRWEVEVKANSKGYCKPRKGSVYEWVVRRNRGIELE